MLRSSGQWANEPLSEPETDAELLEEVRFDIQIESRERGEW